MNKPIKILPSRHLEFEPLDWNMSDTVSLTNCFTYALNRPDLGWLMWNRDFCLVHRGRPEDEYDRLERMGLIGIDKKDIHPGAGHIIAVIGTNTQAAHFLRLDADGRWTHKDGEKPATDKDSKGRIISDPDQASFKDYPRSDYPVIRYYRLPEDGLFLKPLFDERLKLD